MASLEEMDQAAEVAAGELKDLDPKAVKVVAEWWRKYYRTAGHKRLGRQLVTLSRALEEVKE